MAELIVSSPDVMLGKPVFAGTRIPVELVLAKLAGGSSEASLLESYSALSHEHVLAALKYAHQIVRDEDLWSLAG